MFKGILLAATAFALHANAHIINDRLCEGFLPPNNMWIPDDKGPAAGIAQAMFNSVLDRVEQTYAPIIRSMGGHLKIERRWSDGTVNAYADRQGSTWKIVMFGGFARHAAITADGFMAVACHELGHHIGGAPKYGGDWASNEGQSDYWGSLKCLRRIFETEDNQAALNGVTLDPIAVRDCKAQHGSQQDELVCIRATMAAKSLAIVLAEDDPGTNPQLGTPDPAQVAQTYDGHPKGQCRLDTLFEAALCRVPFAQDVSQTSYKTATCITPNDTRGARPRCWFKPN